MAAPPEHNPLFLPLHAGLLPEVLRSLAGRVYLSVAKSPGPPGQAVTTAVELYVDLTSPGMAEAERLRWQRLLGATEDRRLASNWHRSQHANREAVFAQVAQRIAAHPSER